MCRIYKTLSAIQSVKKQPDISFFNVEIPDPQYINKY